MHYQSLAENSGRFDYAVLYITATAAARVTLCSPNRVCMRVSVCVLSWGRPMGVCTSIMFPQPSPQARLAEAVLLQLSTRRATVRTRTPCVLQPRVARASVLLATLGSKRRDAVCIGSLFLFRFLEFPAQSGVARLPADLAYLSLSSLTPKYGVVVLTLFPPTMSRSMGAAMFGLAG